MKSFLYYLAWVAVVVSLLWVGYWGFFSLGEGTAVVYDASLGTATSAPTETLPSIADVVIKNTEPEELPEFLQTPEPVTETQVSIPGEHQQLADSLQNLIDEKVQMKVGSRGTRVGVVQQFLNIFLETDARIDNDFGPGTSANIKKFQSSAGVTADGQPGPQTYQAMLGWLGEQGI
ncbi:MAG: murein L,D-transpeptidase YcbB/YkuD [Planctomycetota bacterium]|jgi:murein L,D-transpeptidase YcbB/YkuD